MKKVSDILPYFLNELLDFYPENELKSIGAIYEVENYEDLIEKTSDYLSKEKAIGLGQYIYACPVCSGIQTIHTKGNDVFCTTCGQIAHFNQYELLEGPSFDNLVDWDRYQKPLIKKAVKNVLYSKGRLIQIDFSKQKRIVLGDMNISLENKNLKLSNQKHQHEFDVDYITGLVLTQKNFLSFDYGEDTFLIRINDPMLFLDSIHYLKGE
jgi:hypothetical protein